MPGVSVITASKNMGHFIGELCYSVYHESKRIQLEHIIVDDNSEDETSDVVHRFQSRYPITFIQTECSQTRALQLALSTSRYETTAWINADDHYLEDGLYRLACAICESDVAYGTVEFCGNILVPPHESALPDKMKTGNFIYQPATIFRTSVAEFNSRFHFTQDYMLWVRLLNNGCSFVRAGLEPCVSMRDHPDRLTHDGTKNELKIKEISDIIGQCKW